MNQHNNILNRLACKARQEAPVTTADSESLYGFTTRILAQTTAQRLTGRLALWEGLGPAAPPAAVTALAICWLAVPRVQGTRVLDTSESLASAMIEYALPLM